MDVVCADFARNLELEVEELKKECEENREKMLWNENQRLVLTKELDASERSNAEMRSVLSAVTCNEHTGIECHDVIGMNWFDARQEALSFTSGQGYVRRSVLEEVRVLFAKVIHIFVSNAEGARDGWWEEFDRITKPELDRTKPKEGE